jgi:hypothetical protein
VPGEPPRLATFGGDHEDVAVAVVLPGEGDPVAVGGELRKILVAHVVGQSRGLAARGGCQPQVTLGGENHRVTLDIGMAQVSLVVRRQNQAARKGDHQENEPNSIHPMEH